jgi:hypothetical protein
MAIAGNSLVWFELVLTGFVMHAVSRNEQAP